MRAMGTARSCPIPCWPWSGPGWLRCRPTSAACCARPASSATTSRPPAWRRCSARTPAPGPLRARWSFVALARPRSARIPTEPRRDQPGERGSSAIATYCLGFAVVLVAEGELARLAGFRRRADRRSSLLRRMGSLRSPGRAKCSSRGHPPRNRSPAARVSSTTGVDPADTALGHAARSREVRVQRALRPEPGRERDLAHRQSRREQQALGLSDSHPGEVLAHGRSHDPTEQRHRVRRIQWAAAAMSLTARFSLKCVIAYCAIAVTRFVASEVTAACAPDERSRRRTTAWTSSIALAAVSVPRARVPRSRAPCRDRARPRRCGQ